MIPVSALVSELVIDNSHAIAMAMVAILVIAFIASILV